MVQSGEWVEDSPIPQQVVQEPIVNIQKISVVLPFIEKEKHSAIELLMRSQQLSGRIARTIFLVPFKGIDFGNVRNAAEGAFTAVAIIQDCEGISSDWNGRQQMRSAAGPNSSFRQVAWFFYLNKKFGSWLWLEPDCWPVTASWLYDLEHEYFDSGKAFMGVRMTFPGNKKQYMNGVGIYPWNAIQYAPLLVQSAMWTQHPEYEVGFDVAGGNDVLNHAHMSRRIQLIGHLSKLKDEVRPETSLCHGRPDLSGSGEAKVNAEADRLKAPVSQQPAQPLSGGINGGQEVADAIQSLPPAQPKGGDADGEEETQEEGQGRGLRLGGDATLKSEQTRSTVKSALTVQPAGAAEYGAETERVRWLVQELVKHWNDKPHRKVLIVKELRKAKLVPKHFR